MNDETVLKGEYFRPISRIISIQVIKGQNQGPPSKKSLFSEKYAISKYSYKMSKYATLTTYRKSEGKSIMDGKISEPRFYDPKW